MEKSDRIIRSCVILCAAALAGFCAIFLAVEAGMADGFDDAVRGFFYGLRNEPLTVVVKALTYLGNWHSVVILCITLLIFNRTRLAYGVPVSVGAALVTVVNKLIKKAVERPRPDDIIHLISEGGYSFPSGHSITSMFVYGMLIYLVRKNVKDRKTADILTAVLAVPMLLIGPSRIYLGVHYPTDVLAGWCLGICAITSFAAIMMFFGWKREERGRR